MPPQILRRTAGEDVGALHEAPVSRLKGASGFLYAQKATKDAPKGNCVAAAAGGRRRRPAISAAARLAGRANAGPGIAIAARRAGRPLENPAKRSARSRSLVRGRAYARREAR